MAVIGDCWLSIFERGESINELGKNGEAVICMAVGNLKGSLRDPLFIVRPERKRVKRGTERDRLERSESPARGPPEGGINRGERRGKRFLRWIKGREAYAEGSGCC